jgi:hypothetical protein
MDVDSVTKRIDFTDIMYAVEMRREGVTVKFTVAHISGLEDGTLPLYAKDDEKGCSGDTREFADADVFLSGRIKWDGCSDMKFDEQERVMLHFCGRSDAVNLGMLMARLYDLAAELMPEHADEL